MSRFFPDTCLSQSLVELCYATQASHSLLLSLLRHMCLLPRLLLLPSSRALANRRRELMWPTIFWWPTTVASSLLARTKPMASWTPIASVKYTMPREYHGTGAGWKECARKKKVLAGQIWWNCLNVFWLCLGWSLVLACLITSSFVFALSMNVVFIFKSFLMHFSWNTFNRLRGVSPICAVSNP